MKRSELKNVIKSIINEETIYKSNGILVMREEVYSKDFSAIKKFVKAAKVFDLEINYVAIGISSWDDVDGNAIFDSNMHLELRGKKWYASVEGKIEQVIPLSTAKIDMEFYRKR